MADVMPPSEPAATPTTATTNAAAPNPQKEIIQYFKSDIAKSKSNRRTFSQTWKTNVDLRLGRTGVGQTNTLINSEGEDYQTEVNPDWSLTKIKTANLFSQVPSVQMTHENKQYEAAVSPFTRAVNYEIGDKRADFGTPMEEVLNDVVNAAGVGAIMVNYSARFEDKQVPTEDLSHLPPEQQQALLQSGKVKLRTVPFPTDTRFTSDRLSPTDLLWPSRFKGSNFNRADYVGRSGSMPWAEGVYELRIPKDRKEDVINQDEKRTEDDLRVQPERDNDSFGYEMVRYDEIYYWRYRVDPNEKNFKSIWRLVFVDGIDEPTIHEPWKGQQPAEGLPNKLVGAMKFPIQFLTLTYVTDNPIPPSDSQAARPQVNDMRRSRAQMFMNRDRSRPIRWFDANRVSRIIQDNLMRGDWQGFIPTNGAGDKAIGEIARASYPPEDQAFDRQTRQDLMDSWQIGPNQAGQLSSGEKTKAEVETAAAGFATRIGQERARVAKFFLDLVEVLSGLMALYSDFPNLTPEERQTMQQAWNSRQVLADLVFKIRPDSTIMLDVNQRIDRLTKLLNITAQSGVVDIVPLITEIIELSDVDPATIIKKPEPQKAPDASISYRFSGKEDMYNPVVMAILVQNNQAPSPEAMAAAKKLLAEAGSMEVLTPPQAPVNPDQPPTTNGEPNASQDYGLAPRVAKRTEEMQ